MENGKKYCIKCGGELHENICTNCEAKSEENNNEIKLELNEVEREQITTQEPAPSVPSGFWRRLAAFIIDSIAVSLLGIVFALLFKNIFVQFGENLWYIGYIIAGAYFVSLNSYIGKGQTIGKMILKIRVLKENGEYLSLPQSFLRYFLVSFIVFLGGITETVYSLLKQNYLFLIISFSIVALFFTIGVIGPIIFTDYKRGLHDYLAKSVVITSREVEDICFAGTDTISEALNKHKIGFGITLIIFLGLSLSLILIPSQITKISFFKEFDFNSMETLKSDLENNCGVSNVSVQSGWSRMTSSKGEVDEYTYFEISCYVKYSDFKDKEYLDKKMIEIKNRAMTTYPSITNHDKLIVTLRSGYNLGISNYTLSYKRVFPLDDN